MVLYLLLGGKEIMISKKNIQTSYQITTAIISKLRHNKSIQS